MADWRNVVYSGIKFARNCCESEWRGVEPHKI